MSNTFKINLLGSSFSFQTNEDPDYINRILSHLEQEINKAQSSFHIKEPLKISLLTCINLIDELFREQNSAEKDRTDAEALAQRLISSIDAALTEEE
ncbi:MAG: cell division protein ZapA [Spirochaetales bacterium]|nr:cell division protein ZapA [Spirochaetales bacterium]